MAQRRSRADRQAQTRQLLVEAAFRCFEARGFAATTLEQIADEAGVTTGAVYSNFENKEALFLELLERIEPQPVDVSMLGDTTCSLAERFRRFGEVNAHDVDLPITTIATWYEVRSFALRNPRAHAAAHDVVLNHMHHWGKQVDERSPSSGMHPLVPGLVAALISQALLDGLRGMRAFLPEEVTIEVFGQATQLLAHLFQEPEAT